MSDLAVRTERKGRYLEEVSHCMLLGYEGRSIKTNMYKHTYSLLVNRLLSADGKNREYSRGEIGFTYMKLLMLADYPACDTSMDVSTYTGNKNKT